MLPPQDTHSTQPPPLAAKGHKTRRRRQRSGAPAQPQLYTSARSTHIDLAWPSHANNHIHPHRNPTLSLMPSSSMRARDQKPL